MSQISKILAKLKSYIARIAIKKYDNPHYKQYLLAENFAINQFLLFSNAFTTNKLRATAACFTCFVGAAFALALLSFVAFLHTAVGVTGLV